MQFEDEGVVSSGDKSTNSVSGELFLEKHFLSNGLSKSGYEKIEKDIKSGDLNVDLLISFDLNDINQLSDQYKLSFVQKKAFINCIKLLPNSKIVQSGQSGSNNVNSNNNTQFVHIFVSPKEQSMFDDINKMKNELNESLKNESNEYNKNEKLINENIAKMENYKMKLKQSIDDAINPIINQLKDRIMDCKKENGNYSLKIKKRNENLDEIEKELNNYLKHKNKMTNNEQTQKIIKIEKQIENSKNDKSNKTKNNFNNICIHDNIDCQKIEKYMKREMNENFFILNDSETKETEMKKDDKNETMINEKIWKWHYCYNQNNYTNNNHKMTNNNKTFECNCDYACYCFVRCNIGMTPNSGIYKIKIKINKIDNDGTLNCIGITTNTDKYNNNTDNTNKDWWYYSNDYIAWSACGDYDKEYFKHGLLCGGYFNQYSNIFYKNGFKYESSNKYNINALPQINVNDIIIMLYDSNKNEMTFIKENDDTCHCKIKNLPKNATCYWFIGHTYKQMNVSIL